MLVRLASCLFFLLERAHLCGAVSSQSCGVGTTKAGINLGRFPFDHKFQDFRSEIEWNGKNSGLSFRKLGIRFECTLFDGISGNIENIVFHSQKMLGLVSLPSVGDRTIRFPVCHTPKEQQYLFFWQNCGPPR